MKLILEIYDIIFDHLDYKTLFSFSNTSNFFKVYIYKNYINLIFKEYSVLNNLFIINGINVKNNRFLLISKKSVDGKNKYYIKKYVFELVFILDKQRIIIDDKEFSITNKLSLKNFFKYYILNFINRCHSFERNIKTLNACKYKNCKLEHKINIKDIYHLLDLDTYKVIKTIRIINFKEYLVYNNKNILLYKIHDNTEQIKIWKKIQIEENTN